MTNKLLSDEELATKLIRIAKGIGKTYDDSIDAKLEQSILNLIKTQKRLYAEMAIGSDWVNPTLEVQDEINKEHARQRARITQ